MAGKRKTSKYAMIVKDYCKKNKGQKDLFKHAAKAWKSQTGGGGEPMPLDSESSVAANAGPSTGGSRRSRRRGGSRSRRSRQSRRSRR